VKRTTREAARRWLPCLCAILLAGPGCQSTPEQPPETTTTEGGFTEGSVPDEPTQRGPVLDLGIVYFDYDSAVIRDDARPTLKTNAEHLRGANASVTLEGHCDERGSEEYNLALGERRARSVKRYLVDLGVPSAQVTVVSFGEAKPAVMGHDESAWRWNRRVEFRTGS
jgi:peptidoglycan-associated lipoprotein